MPRPPAWCWQPSGAKACGSSSGPASRASSGAALALIRADGEAIVASHLLVAAGRAPRTEDLELAAAGVRVAPDGIVVDRRRRTSNPRISAVGDCRQGPRLTHLAAEDGAAVVRDIGFGWPARADPAARPRVIHTDPALAQLGLTEAEARRAGRGVTVQTQPFARDDRAVTEGHTEASCGWSGAAVAWSA